MTTRSEPTIRQEMRQFICTELINNPAYPLLNDEPLMSDGLIDSFCIAHMAAFIEAKWGLYIPDPELTVENLDTLDLIVARILRK